MTGAEFDALAALTRMQDRVRVATRARLVDGLSYKQAAAVSGLSVGAVRQGEHSIARAISRRDSRLRLVSVLASAEQAAKIDAIMAD